jgi:hypothetical protein
VPQVVLAHSHGGTVAVKALDTRDELRGGRESPDVRALLTLGTPFVRLVWQWRRETEGGRQVAMLLPPLLRVLALHARRGGPSRRSGPKTKPRQPAAGQWAIGIASATGAAGRSWLVLAGRSTPWVPPGSGAAGTSRRGGWPLPTNLGYERSAVPRPKRHTVSSFAH